MLHVGSAADSALLLIRRCCRFDVAADLAVLRDLAVLQIWQICIYFKTRLPKLLVLQIASVMPLLQIHLVSLCGVEVRVQLVKHCVVSERKSLRSNVIIVVLKCSAGNHNRECHLVLLILVDSNLSTKVVEHLNLCLKDIVLVA